MAQNAMAPRRKLKAYVMGLGWVCLVNVSLEMREDVDDADLRDAIIEAVPALRGQLTQFEFFRIAPGSVPEDVVAWDSALAPLLTAENKLNVSRLRSIEERSCVVGRRVGPVQGGPDGATAADVTAARATSAAEGGAAAPRANVADLSKLVFEVVSKLGPRSHLVLSPSGYATQYAQTPRGPLLPSPAPPPAPSASGQPKNLKAARRKALVPLLDEAAEERVQPFLAGVFDALCQRKGYKSVIIDCHSAPTYATRKPDFVAFRATPAGGPVSRDVSDVVFIGEAKKTRRTASAGIFTEQEKGHVLSLLSDLVQEQVYRAGGYLGEHQRAAVAHAFIADSQHIVLFRVTFDCPESGRGTVLLKELRETAPMPLAADGLAALDAWLRAEPSTLGYVLPNLRLADGSALCLRALLGVGATSIVYAASNTVNDVGSAPAAAAAAAGGDGPRFAVKLYRNNAAAGAISTERDALTACAGARNVVQLVAFDSARHALVLQPVCRTSFALHGFEVSRSAHRLAAAFAGLAAELAPAGSSGAVVRRPGSAEFCDLIDALAALHARGWVHRDSRAENFFRDDEGVLVLSDLGAAVPVGAVPPLERPFGFFYGPLRVLEALKSGTALPPAEPAHDWEQVARLALATAAGVSVSSTEGATNASTLLEAWAAADATILARGDADAASQLLQVAMGAWQRASDTALTSELKAAICRLIV